MDRFIDPLEQLEFFKNSILKSNMDRFIADILSITKSRIENFKIQYG